MLAVAIRDGRLLRFRPRCAPALRLAWRADCTPEEAIVGALRAIGVAAQIVHSTSWRREGSNVILTYVAVVGHGATPDAWSEQAVMRTPLARGGRLEAPGDIRIEEVLEHALRHLARLSHTDAAVRGALGGGKSALAGYSPEMFLELPGSA